MPRLHIASEKEILRGKTTDVYFERTRKILKAKRLKGKQALAEVTASDFPDGWKWAVLCGVEEAARLFEGHPVNVYSLPEGTLFHACDHRGVRTLVMTVEGAYYEYCVLETPLLGFLCQASGIATKAARIRKLAGESLLVSFGIRRMHPAIAPMIDRAAYIGGFDAVSCLAGAELIGERPTGTMPHALIILLGDVASAMKAFDNVVEPEAPRIALVDTFLDEKVEALKAAEALGKKLFGVRLDTPASRRGDFTEIIREVRWELNLRGYSHVKIFVSGGIEEGKIPGLLEAGVEGFGVGTSLSNAPTIDFALDLVEVEGKPVAKRGKLAGRKNLWRCGKCMVDLVLPAREPRQPCPSCGGKMRSMLKPLILNGKLAGSLPKPSEIRRYLLSQLEKVEI
ncbi:TPA: nicotinate phosphoribosyltransferase [Candidatus Bathyarchaeota archaeon]|nr:nicotinate phosphoribosyltransferase [Candidatus Bathyarchaeota archaeon]